MALDRNDDLDRALKALRIRDVWALAFTDGILTAPPPDRDGLVESPFREDGRRGSFSICHDGHGYNDFGGQGVKGGVWKFHELCWPNLEKKERARQLIDLAARHGHLTLRPVAPPAATDPAAPAPAMDPKIEKAAKAIERRDRLRAAENAAYQAREDALRAPPPKKIEPCPAFVLEAFREGIAHLREQPRRIAEMAKDRGWPEDWAWQLVDQELLSWPWERGARPGEKYAGRQKAFAVQIPHRDSINQVFLQLVGYHQRFYVPARDNQTEVKGWLYVPSLPKHRPRSIFEEQLVAYGKGLGFDWDERKAPPALLPPVPFAMGDMSSPRLIVLLEGQWDAITFFGACGYFNDATPPTGILVFGIRGAQGMDAFLAHWGDWLRSVKPRAWLIADNDAAGGTWRDAPPAAPGLPRPPSLADRLKHAGCRDPLISWLKKNPARPRDKDFNDFYRAARPSAEKMFGWMRATGVVDANGKFL